MNKKDSAEKTVRDIRRKPRRRHSSEENIRIVLDGLRGEDSISALCRREGKRFGSFPCNPLQPRALLVSQPFA